MAKGPSFWESALVGYLLKGALALPFVMLAAVLIASLERTPVTGRWRLLLLNEKEELDIVHSVLQVGETELSTSGMSSASSVQGAEERDWIAILKAVLGEDEQNSLPGTLLGGKVLDPTDWRVQLAESVLAKLEENVTALYSADSAQLSQRLSILPPPLRHPLSKSERTKHHKGIHNSILVVERPESNAFSFGFYGATEQNQPGVIIVFTGAIDDIMQAGLTSTSATLVESAPALGKKTEVEAKYALDYAPKYSHSSGLDEPSWIRSFFGSILPTASLPHIDSSFHGQVEQGVAVSREQEEALAILLAHELAHLVLSHTIESYASTTLLWPQLEKLGWDMLRVFIYPLTMVLGPFVQDAISATVKVGMEESGGLLPALNSSCESRAMEFEADQVALRLLANSGIDPRSSVDFWEKRLVKRVNANISTTAHDTDTHVGSHYTHNHVASSHASTSGVLDRVVAITAASSTKSTSESFASTHPADEDRIIAIRRELARWQHVQPA